MSKEFNSRSYMKNNKINLIKWRGLIMKNNKRNLIKWRELIKLKAENK